MEKKKNKEWNEIGRDLISLMRRQEGRDFKIHIGKINRKKFVEKFTSPVYLEKETWLECPTRSASCDPNLPGKTTRSTSVWVTLSFSPPNSRGPFTFTEARPSGVHNICQRLRREEGGVRLTRGRFSIKHTFAYLQYFFFFQIP